MVKGVCVMGPQIILVMVTVFPLRLVVVVKLSVVVAVAAVENIVVV